MSQMPHIKAEVNKEPQREKKKSGLLARLFGGGSGGGAMGTGGAGMGGLAGGGMMATKAGLMALVLVGTTVAGGIGLVGYRLFGPGQDANNGENLQLFAAKPKDAQPAEDPNGAAKDGSSKSLEFAAQANGQPKAPEISAAAAPKDESAASASSSAETVASGAGSSPINAAGSSSSGVNKNLLKGGGNFGKLSSGFSSGGGGGGSSASAGSGGSGKPGEALATGSRNGATSGMKKGGAMAGGSRAIASRKGSGKALGQAFASLKDGRGATTSYGAGKTFDGSAAASGGNAGPEGGAIGMAGPGTADGGAQAKTMPNAQNDKREFKAPPDPKSVDAAPWQNAIKTAQAIVAVAGLLLLAASVISKAKPYGAIIAKAIGFLVAGLGAMVIALGAQISGGQYGQKVQGGVLAAAGLGLVLAGMMTGMADNTDGKGATTDANGDPIANADAGGSSAFNASTDSNAGLMSSINPWVLLGGGVAVVGVAATAMIPPKKYPSKEFENGNPPDTHWFGYRQAPSETALEKYLV